MTGLEIYAAISFGFTAVLIILYLIVFKVLRKNNNDTPDETTKTEE
ncbi:MAG: hypothetical protein IKV89_04860 [Clostridia bacterium]|nr:hypothetical protein [Clostridia bacterium]